MLSTLSETNFKFSVTFNLSSANAFNLDQSKKIFIWKRVESHDKTGTKDFKRLQKKISQHEENTRNGNVST